jgi:hypothetical protein
MTEPRAPHDDEPPPVAFDHATFRAQLDSTFALDLGTEPVPLRLAEVSDERTGGGFRSFSVLFHGPAERLVPQGTYLFHHETMGSLALFIVPVVGSNAERILYEASFSQPVVAPSSRE